MPFWRSVHRAKVPFWRSVHRAKVPFSDGTLPFWKSGQNTVCYLRNDTTHNTIHITEASTANSCAVWVESECGLANASYFTLNRTFVQFSYRPVLCSSFYHVFHISRRAIYKREGCNNLERFSIMANWYYADTAFEWLPEIFMCDLYMFQSLYMAILGPTVARSATTYAHLRHNQDLSHHQCALHRLPRWNSVGWNSLQSSQPFLPDRCLIASHRRRHDSHPLVATTVEADGVHQSCRRFHGSTWYRWAQYWSGGCIYSLLCILLLNGLKWSHPHFLTFPDAVMIIHHTQLYFIVMCYRATVEVIWSTEMFNKKLSRIFVKSIQWVWLVELFPGSLLGYVL